MDQNNSQSDTSKFIRTWLAQQRSQHGYTAFQHLPLSEIDNTRDVILSSLAETIFIHHNDPEELKTNLTKLGYLEAMEELDKRPHSPTTRKANFGEILASEYLSQTQGYQIPVYRLRYNPNPESSMKGDDVLAFKFGDPDGKGKEIVVVEAKVRSRFATQVVKKAYTQLQAGHRPRPKSIIFIVTILRKEGRNDEADQVLEFLNKFANFQPVQRNLLFLVTGNQPRDPFRYVQEQQNVLRNLQAVNVPLSSLNSLVKELFDYEFDIEVEVDGS
jgi:hypothetical protein